jgi:hypothetical protein
VGHRYHFAKALTILRFCSGVIGPRGSCPAPEPSGCGGGVEGRSDIVTVFSKSFLPCLKFQGGRPDPDLSHHVNPDQYDVIGMEVKTSSYKLTDQVELKEVDNSNL